MPALRPCASFLSPCLLSVVVTLFSTAPARGAVITLADFSGSETVETFNSATPNDSAAFFDFGDFIIENTGDLACCPAPGGPTVVVAGAFTSNLFGHVDASAASFGNSIRDGQGQAHFFLDFEPSMERAGFFLSHSSSPPASWNVTAHYGDGSMEMIVVTQQNAAEDEFVGFEDASGVETIEVEKIAGAFAFYSFIDDVRFEIPVPEPGSASVLGSGVGLLGLLSRRRRAQLR